MNSTGDQLKITTRLLSENQAWTSEQVGQPRLEFLGVCAGVGSVSLSSLAFASNPGRLHPHLPRSGRCHFAAPGVA